MSATVALMLVLAFLVKHFIADFLLQKPYQYLNKGKYGHPGGLVHAGIHGVGTIIVLLLMFPPSFLVFWLVVFDMVSHYHIDWLKVNINEAQGWTATTSDNFWHLVGLDQLAHQLVYIVIIYMMI